MAKKLEDYVTDPLTYEKIIRSLDVNRSNFVESEPKKRRRFYDTIRTVDYFNHEKETEIIKILHDRGSGEG